MKSFLAQSTLINTWHFFLFYVIYSILSTILFVFTNGGYTLIGTTIVCIIGFGILFIILVIGTTIKYIRSFKKLYILKNIFYFILIPCQIILLFITKSDCGDSPCVSGYDSNFLRQIFFPDMQPIQSYLIYDFRVVFQFLYVFTLIYFFITPLLSKKDVTLTR